MKQRLLFFLFPLSIIALPAVFLWPSCKKNPATPPDVGYSYFPDATGKYVVYEVDSVFQNDTLNSKDTLRYLLKEVIESIFTDNEGRPSMRIERYMKYYNPQVPYSQMQWQLKDVWMATRTSTTAEKVEENVRYLKLVFPLSKGKDWNGNVYNTKPEWEYQVTEYDKPLVLGALSFDSTLTVEQINRNILTRTEYSVEKYARNVGLIYKEMLILDKQPENAQDTPPFNDTSGYYYTAKAIEFGN
jgi:hypothetical protein